MIAAVRSQPRGAARTRALLALLLSPVAVCLCLTVIIVVASSAAASAQFILADPDGTVKGLASGWTTQAILWAKRIYLALLIFELIALAVTTLLFRENVAEFFASVGLKVFVGGIYFWFIINAGVGGGWASQIVNSFQNVGTTFGTRDASWVTGEGLAAAGAYFAAGPVAQGVAQVAATASAATSASILAAGCTYTGTVIPAVVVQQLCPVYTAASPFSAAVAPLVDQSYPFTLITAGMGLMIMMALAAIWLQIIIMTIESYIVMGAGAIFIGFAGSRFTMPFSQGYFSYMFNVGVKFMVLYIVLGIEQHIMPTILGNAVVTLGASFFPGGEYVALTAAAFGLVNVIIAAALVWMLPGLAGSFLTGQSSASGSAVLGQVMGQMASASSMMANLHQAQRSGAAAKRQNTAAHTTPSNQNANVSGYGPDDHSVTSAAPGANPFAGDSANSQSGALARGLAGTPTPDRNESEQDRARDNRAMADTYRAAAMTSLASGAPRDIGGPTAVQVRLSNPDKL